MVATSFGELRAADCKGSSPRYGGARGLLMRKESVSGTRRWSGEATWLGAAVLVPRGAALAILRSGTLSAEIAAHFGVGEDLRTQRIGQTGILVQFERARRWAGD